MLNADQRRIFEHVKEHLLHQQQYEANQSHCDLKPLRKFVSSVGGTVKSLLIEAITALVTSMWLVNVCYCSAHWLST